MSENKKVVLTYEGLKKLEEELEELKTVRRKEVAEKIKEAIRTLFVNDSSSARPDGSMVMHKLYWWKHNCKIGQYSSHKVHNSIEIKKKEGVRNPRKIEDYEIICHELPGLAVEEYEGL